MEFFVGILGNLVAELFSKTGQFVFNDLKNDPKWIAWKTENQLSKNNSDFLDRYGETLVSFKQADKPKALLKFFAEKNVVEIIHDHWYGNIEELEFEKQFDDLARWFTLDEQLTGFSSAKEVGFFLTKFDEAVHANRTAGEAENHQRLVRIENLLERFLAYQPTETIDLNGKLMIFCHADDRPWVEENLTKKLEAGGIEIYLEDREYRMGDYGLLSEKFLSARRSLIVFSKNFGKNQKRLLSGFIDEFGQEKLIPLRLDDTEVFEEFETYIDLSAGHDSLKNFVRQISTDFGIASPPLPFPPLAEEHVNITALPHQGASDHLFGRQKELKMLDEAWADSEVHVISFVAHGGVGKSALISRWVSDMAKENYRGANRVLATSFYSQGTTDRVASSDLWMNEALHWFDEKEYDTRSPWDKGKRLAQLINEHRTLLLLDGLEPMQEGGQVGKGTVKDPALATLIRQLAKRNNGLLVITTREALAGFERFAKNMRSQNLETISDEAGKHILRFAGRRGIQGSDSELVAAVREFGNHAFAVNLLGSYIYSLPGRPISAAFEIPDLPEVSVEKGKHPRRVISILAYKLEKDGKIEAHNILKYLGFFDRPISQDIFKIIDEEITNPIIPIHELRERKIIYDKLIHAPEMVDCHPLVREHFMEILENDFPEIWQKGNEKLYRYYEALPEQLYGKYLPDTLEEMEPLFLAIKHGCMAKKFSETLSRIYEERISRGDNYYINVKLGAFRSDLSALSWFFESLWTKPYNNLKQKQTAFLLGWSVFALRAMGQYKLAIEPIKLCINSWEEKYDWRRVSIESSSQSELYIAIGELNKAKLAAEKCVSFARKARNAPRELAGISTLAEAFLQLGEKTQLHNLYTEAKKLHKLFNKEYPYLYSMPGHRYNDFLLETDKPKKVFEAANYTLELSKNELSLWDYGLNILMIAKSYSLLPKHNLKKKKRINLIQYFSKAVSVLREAGVQEFLAKALLARAAYYRTVKNWLAALEDLEEVLDIAEPSGMRLHLTDYHLEMSRLCLAMSVEQPEQKAEAKEHLKLATQLVEDTGYHRRDGEVAALREALG